MFVIGSTGVCGLVGILDALVKRAESGGSYRVEVIPFLPYSFLMLFLLVLTRF